MNTWTTSDQRVPSVGMDESGNFMVMWQSFGQDGSSSGIFGQRFSASDCPPLTLESPAGQTACLGGVVSFRVTASVTGPFNYQWRKDGVNLTDGADVSGARSTVLAIENLALEDAGSYDCRVSDYCLPTATATTSAAALTVLDQPAPGPVANLRVRKAPGGANLVLTWDDTSHATDYVVFDETLPFGPFSAVAGVAPNGSTGLTIPMPASTHYYLVAGRSPACEIGPKR